LVELESTLPTDIARANASARSKIGKIYRLMDQSSEVRAPQMACTRKCADCCRMNVSISGLEAKLIAEATGLKVAAVEDSVKHELDRFVGVACPFLRDDLRTIYEHRPMVCRNHASFYVTAKWCMPEYSLRTGAPMVNFSGIDEAYVAVSSGRGRMILADTRDFFPTASGADGAPGGAP
jgi:uncharacterized protein